jgi:AcrR family transcriptional regulator
MTGRDGPGLRVDARANHDRVLSAAAEVFTEQGIEASIDIVAQRAGVGIGTVYRRFESKAGLLEEVGRRLLLEVDAAAERHLQDPAGMGLESYLRELCARFARGAGSPDLLWRVPSTTSSDPRLRELQRALVEQAKRAGRVRADLIGEDVTAAIWSVYGILRAGRNLPAGAWRRHLELLMLGFRATTLLPHALDADGR